MSYLEHLISIGNYADALEFVKTEMNNMRDKGEIDEEKFTELYTQRIIINQKLGKSDDLITEAIRQEKYPASQEFKLSNKTKAVLEFKNLFHKKSDAYVNTIHVNKYFNYLQMELSSGFLKQLGVEKIDLQLSKIKSNERGSVFTLEHNELNSPISFHILYYTDDEAYDEAALEKGIINVLKEAEKRNLKEITFPALSYYHVIKAAKEDKNRLASQIAETIGAVLQTYFSENTKTSIETVSFCFVNPYTFLRFETAFQRTKQQYFILRNLSHTQKNLISAAKTLDSRYIELLKELAYSVGDNSNILLLGETGVGKSFIAKVIHENSPQGVKEFYSFNCSTLQKELIFSQLFGAKEGSFTDSKKPIKGMLEEANNSTLFLDEIGAIDTDIQKRLLTFLDDKTFYRLGDNNKINSNVRLIFGTNIDLDQAVTQGLMLRDFRERISEREFEIPALRDRKVDIRNIIDSILQEEIELNKYSIELDDEALEMLINYSWPGNYRQLKFYIKAIYNLSFHKNINRINKEIIKAKPPRDENVSIDKLEKLLTSFLREWDENKGKFVDDILLPSVVKVFSQNLNFNKSDSDKFLGITGTSGKPTLFDKYLAKYPEILEKLNRK